MLLLLSVTVAAETTFLASSSSGGLEAERARDVVQSRNGADYIIMSQLMVIARGQVSVQSFAP